MGSIGGQASGDFRLSTSALRILYALIKDSIPSLAPDGLTQNNPNVIAAIPAAKSTTIPVNVKKGVLGGSVAFCRPDVGPNTVGGAVLVAAAYVPKTRPLGLFINDAAGNAFENTPGPASGKGPFLRGGACGVKLYETERQTVVGGGGAIGDDLVYSEGDFLYASVNGYLTNRWQDSYECQWINATGSGSGPGPGFVCIEPDVIRLGVLLAGPDSTSSEIFLELYA